MSGRERLDPAEHPDDLLSAYLDDELAAGDVARVEAHLVRCAPCSAELDELADARRMLRALPPVPAPAGFTRGIVERRHRATRRGATLALVAASVAAVLGLVVANPATERTDRRSPLSLTSDASRFRPPAPGSGPTSGSPGGTDAPAPTTTAGPGSTTTTTVDAGTGSEEDPDPVTVGDRMEDAAASLLRLIGGG